MSEKTRAIDAFESLIDEARFRTLLASDPDYRKLQRCLKNGEEIPDDLLPGRLLNKLSEQEREELKKLKSEWVTKRRLG